MSRLTKVPAVGWVVVGVAVAVLAVPTVAEAKAVLKYTGIEGTSGNQADVTTAGQLQTAAAGPAAAYVGTVEDNDTTGVAIAQASPGQAMMITSIAVDSWGLSTSDPYVFIYMPNTSTCGTYTSLSLEAEDDPGSDGNTVYPFDPGLPLPAGDVLCASAYDVSTTITVSGYAVPASDVPAAVPGSRVRQVTKPGTTG
jgi:hypothetical protein